MMWKGRYRILLLGTCQGLPESSWKSRKGKWMRQKKPLKSSKGGSKNNSRSSSSNTASSGSSSSRATQKEVTRQKARRQPLEAADRTRPQPPLSRELHHHQQQLAQDQVLRSRQLSRQRRVEETRPLLL